MLAPGGDECTVTDPVETAVVTGICVVTGETVVGSTGVAFASVTDVVTCTVMVAGAVVAAVVWFKAAVVCVCAMVVRDGAAVVAAVTGDVWFAATVVSAGETVVTVTLAVVSAVVLSAQAGSAQTRKAITRAKNRPDDDVLHNMVSPAGRIP
ncbi:MAG: hypothetical protein A4E33_01537 [Methanoregula sp. PtaB.Bin085]|nr:MAG: hypothetical protein A4E33_01537 [Methanoregula sp. PtaB.Bin085]